jgi:hypothetical protein
MYKLKIKSQIAIEFTIFLLIMFAMFIIFYKSSFTFALDSYRIHEEHSIIDMSLKLKKEIFIAFESRNGYERIIELPDKLNNKYPYTIKIDDRVLIVRTENNYVDIIIPFISSNINETDKLLKIIKDIDGNIELNSYP